MDFNLSKEQELLRDGLGRFLSTRYYLEKSRASILYTSPSPRDA
jgi:hypothetical protein